MEVSLNPGILTLSHHAPFLYKLHIKTPKSITESLKLEILHNKWLLGEKLCIYIDTVSCSNVVIIHVLVASSDNKNHTNRSKPYTYSRYS